MRFMPPTRKHCIHAWNTLSAPPPFTVPVATPPQPYIWARVAEYTGPRITRGEADQAYRNSPVIYLFGLGNGSVVIDG